MKKYNLIITNIYTNQYGNLIVNFKDNTNQEYYMNFVSKMANYIIRNIYYNATGKYYNDQNLDFVKSAIVGKEIIGISNTDDLHIHQTRPLNQTENQKYRDSEEWNNLKVQVARIQHFTCNGCGKVFTDKSYEIHHSDYYAGSNIEYTDKDPVHYKLYCRTCHQTVHDLLL